MRLNEQEPGEELLDAAETPEPEDAEEGVRESHLRLAGEQVAQRLEWQR